VICAILPLHGVVTPMTALVGFDVYNFLVIRNFIAPLHFNIDDCGFGDRFASCGHDDWDLRHKFLFSKAARDFSRDLFALGLWVDQRVG